MNLLPIEFYLILVIVIPLGICFAKWTYSLSWPRATLICSGSSWIYFNLWTAKLDPPENGFVNWMYLVSGWVWMLPLFGLFCMIFRLVEGRVSQPMLGKVGSRGFKACAVVTALIVVWNLFGRMNEQRAITEARRELIKRGYVPAGREIPKYVDGHWIIRYPDTEFGEIRLSRNGKMSWIGGPG